MTDERADFYDSGAGTVEAAYERFREDEWAEHMSARGRDVEVVPDWKPQRRQRRRESTAQRVHPTVAWELAVLDRDQGCCVHANPADCEHGHQAHHVVSQQLLRQSHAGIVWNPLVGMGVCGLAHRQHHNRVRPIMLDEIPMSVVVFLREQGFNWYLERHYP